MHLAWVFTGLSGLAALGLVGLMAYAKELEAEQARRRSVAMLGPGIGGKRSATTPPPATPERWDDEDFEVPQAAAALNGSSEAAAHRARRDPALGEARQGPTILDGSPGV